MAKELPKLEQIGLLLAIISLTVMAVNFIQMIILAILLIMGKTTDNATNLPFTINTYMALFGTISLFIAMLLLISDLIKSYQLNYRNCWAKKANKTEGKIKMKAQVKLPYIDVENEEIKENHVFINGYNNHRLVIIPVKNGSTNKFKLLIDLTTGMIENGIINSMNEMHQNTAEITVLGSTEIMLKELLDTDVDRLYYDITQPKPISFEMMEEF